MSTFDEIITLSLNGVLAAPFLFYIYNNDPKWLYVALYSFLNIQIHDLIKSQSKKFNYEFLKRPIGAKNCDLFSMNGNVEGQPGFPSGHVTSAVSFFTGVGILFPEYRHSAIIGGTIYSILMVISRINKKCHTPLQTFAGASLGLLGTYLLNKVFFP
jgi:membrane-associated phospholipid phosphatase